MDKLHKDRIDAVIASIKNACVVDDPKKGLGFNMGVWRSKAYSEDMDLSGHACGTVACIAGHTQIVAYNDKEFRKEAKHYGDYGEYPLKFSKHLDNANSMAGAYLGLAPYEASHLFLGSHFRRDGIYADLESITPKEAIKVLKHLKKTGEVTWDVAST